MRQKTDEKRQQILRIASDLFLKQGLDAVSLSQIAAQVGGSKSTIYSYFRNKEELFLEVVLSGIKQMVESAASSLDSGLPLFEKLHLLGVKYLTFILAEDTIALRRIIIATSNRGEVGSEAYHQIISESWTHVAELLGSAMKGGFIKEGDPWQAATLLRCLFEYDLLDRRLLNIDKATSLETIEKTVTAGLEIFQRVYQRQ